MRIRLALLLSSALVIAACKPAKADRRSQRTGGEDAAAPTTSPDETLLAQLPPSFYLPKETLAIEESVCLSRSSGDVANEQGGNERLSDSYQNNCSGCHGTAGEGREGFPKLQSYPSAERFIEVVRAGGARMPAFAPDLISDDALAQDYARLAKPLAELDSQTVDWQKGTVLGEADFAAIMKEGLLAWRLPGERGACMSCHGPDGIDLARLDYSNGSILRRALGQGLAQARSIAIVRMIAALRGRYAVSSPCHAATFSPLQPAGRALEGDSASEKESLLAGALEERGVKLRPSAITSLSEATSFWKLLADLDVRKFPIAIGFNRWTEDSFHGDAHRSTAEWLPEIPLEPKEAGDLGEWISRQNAYLQEPTDEALWTLLDMVPKLSAARFTSGGVSERLAREKYKSVLLLQHELRLGSARFPDLTKTADKNRFFVWETAQISSVMARGCADPGSDDDPYPCWKYPVSFYKKMGTDRARLLDDVLAMTLPWLVAGWVQDPALQVTEGGDAQMAHLHLASEKHFERIRRQSDVPMQLPLHNLYFSLVRLARSVDAPDVRLPSGAHLDETPVASCWTTVGPGLAQWVDDTLPAIERMLDLDKAATGAAERQSTAFDAIATTHRAIIWRMIDRLEHPLEACKALKHEAMSLADALTKITAWHEKTGHDVEAIKSLVAKLDLAKL